MGKKKSSDGVRPDNWTFASKCPIVRPDPSVAVRIVITAGGTGGHLIPAQALARQLQAHPSSPEILFVAGGLTDKPFFARGEFRFVEVPSGRPRKPLRIANGTLQSLGVLSSFKPDLVVGFGSFHTFPVLLAATLGRTPIILHEGNATPGLVNRLFAKRALFTGVQFPNTPIDNGIHIPLPLRPIESHTPQAARIALGLEPDRTTIAVLGGSQGAVRLNQIAHAALSTRPNIQVIHLTGHGNPLPHYPFPAHVVPFETRMPLVWSAADRVIMRAGASSIAEHLAYRISAILIPYPHAADDHQNANADCAVSWGGALKILETDLTEERLLAALDTPLNPPSAPEPETDLYTTILNHLELDS